MSDPTLPPSAPEHRRSPGYETRDVRPKYVALLAVGLIVVVAAVLPFLRWLFNRFEAQAERRDPTQSPLAAPQIPPAPRLQTQPSADLEALRKREKLVLEKYDWIDEQNGVVQIPIDRAMELLAERGLPEPEQPPQKNRPAKPRQEAVP